MDSETWGNIALVLLFILIGGVFAGTEIALVSLRESQINQLERQSTRGARVASVARDPNRFLAAVQIGVTVAGFFSAAYGASTIAPDFAPAIESLGVPEGPAGTIALVVLTLVIAYLSLVLGELVPKRIALQQSGRVALAVAPPLDRFATLMRPVIWLLSTSTNLLVRLFGGDPHATSEEMSEAELRDLVIAHQGLPEDERRILGDVFEATDRSVAEVMRPRGEVHFLEADLPLTDALDRVRDQPWSRYPVIGEDFDDVLGFLHIRELLDTPARPGVRVRDVMREIVVLPGTNKLLPSLSSMRREGVHIAVVVDEYGGTDGIVTLEDLVEELVGDIRDEYDMPGSSGAEAREGAPGSYDAGITIEEFTELTGVRLADGPYETVAGYVIARLGRLGTVGDAVEVDGHRIEVTAVEGRRIARVRVVPPPEEPAPVAPAPVAPAG
ncbi:membrane protein [Cellulomonas hominis]|jgi:putative hemolysin|uniref:Membrane protein n=1 Tax=Cellulomonas hominis TaxID=156981 RepID=A0A511F9E4_9CELL|nr:hemolysin family protein [Cellulomonas hominis]MBB5473008.1 putative hemolysin [Cellulomonas hominis]GEL45853.1 membrane protein [Cellulomonas hominis]